MSFELYLVATQGIDKLSVRVKTGELSLDAVLDAMPEVDDASHLLRAGGLLSFHRKAGYLPGKDPRKLAMFLSPDEEHQQHYYDREIVRFLGLVYQRQYNPIYPEWLHYVALDDVTFPYEALPLMLNLASDMPSTQALTKRILGSRGRWLVEQSGNRLWQWAKSIKPARRPRLTKYTKKESRIIEILAKNRFRRLTLEVNYELRLMNFPWSKHFSRIIAGTIESMIFSNQGVQFDDLIRIADLTQWNIHPDESETLLKIFSLFSQDKEARIVSASLNEILAFRSDMLARFEKRSS